jgi:hypothetical protein
MSSFAPPILEFINDLCSLESVGRVSELILPRSHLGVRRRVSLKLASYPRSGAADGKSANRQLFDRGTLGTAPPSRPSIFMIA